MTNLETLSKWVQESSNIVFFGGAGVSTESGIPDFRSVDGLYHQSYAYPPETILSHSFFMHKPKEFFRFYREKMIFSSAKPNAAHLKLAEWEREGKLLGIVTQNIDGLHTLAGCKRIFELHGSVYRNHCMACGKAFSLEDVLSQTGVPHCSCGGIIKPDVVLYEEALDEDVLKGALRVLSSADLLIVGGTSLSVYPAAGLLTAYQGHRLVLINRDPTPRDREADLIIRDPIAKVMGQLP